MLLKRFLKPRVLDRHGIFTGIDEVKNVTSIVVCLAGHLDARFDVVQHHVRTRHRGAVLIGYRPLHLAAIILSRSGRSEHEHQCKH